MAAKRETMRIAMPAWEIGRANSGLGAKVGGLAVIIEELPSELVKAAAAQGIDLTVEVLSPCFGHYDRSRLTNTGQRYPVTIDGHTFDFEVYTHTFPDGITVVYFWDEWQLHWTTATAIYPDDPIMAMKLFAAVSQAMAGYIRENDFATIHSHDYHVGLIPFYLGDAFLEKVPHHFTIHNATYQGIYPAHGRGYETLYSLNLPGDRLFHKYFDFFDNLNFMKAVMLKTHEMGGKITTVSGDIEGTWGYAAELREGHGAIQARAEQQKGGPVGEVFVPNRHNSLFEILPIAGITNGMSAQNKPENLPALKAEFLRTMQERQGPDNPIFAHPEVQQTMLDHDHNFDLAELDVKVELKRLLYLEAFDSEPRDDPILITVVGRLVAQKNLGLVVDVIEPTLAYDSNTHFIILASAPEGDSDGKATEAAFFNLSLRHPGRVYFNNTFNFPLSKLIFAGGDFTLIPSRFEPCGLVDYEASLLGNVVIGRLTGGLAKVRHCAYLYQWLDISDRSGEAYAFYRQIQNAIDTYRQNPARHRELLETAMALDATWDRSAAQYVHMYRYGLLMRCWRQTRRQLIDGFIESLKDEEALFEEFFIPGPAGYNDALDWMLKDALRQDLQQG